MTSDAACLMNLELNTEHHEACEPGEFALTDQELEMLASILKAQAKQCPEFEGFSISMVAEYDEEQKQQQRTPAQEEIAQDEAAEMYVQKSKRARVSTDATAASSSAVLVRDSDSDSVCVTGDGRAARKRVSQKTARKEAIPLTESASVKSPPQAEIVTQRPCLNLDDDSLQYEVLEVMTRNDADSAVGLHLSKGTFASEEEYVKKRVHAGEVWRCRTWVLRGLLKPSDQERSYLAAVTCTMNPYKNKEGCWAQILNMSALRERHGYGTLLVAGFEELVRRESVDVVTLYPAMNGRAPNFWASLGFTLRSDSMLPPEELGKGGPLCLEIDPATGESLPRWERRIAPPTRIRDATRTSRASWTADVGAASRLSGQTLIACANAAKLRRERYKRFRRQNAAEAAIIG